MDPSPDRRPAGRYRHLRLPGGADTGRPGTGPAQGAGVAEPPGRRPVLGQAAAVCDLYLRPPAGAVVICIDEKTGIPAKYRKYPAAGPARPGGPAGVDTSGAAPFPSSPRCRSPPGRSSPSRSPATTGHLHRLPAPPGPVHRPRLNIHLIMDNGSSHTSRATRAWIAAHPGSGPPTRRGTPRGWTWPNSGSGC